MTATDIRDLHWQQLREQLNGLRETVHAALVRHGPCTTRQLAQRAELDILTVRPRVTDLLQLGFAECTGREGGEGIYRALSYDEAAAQFSDRQKLARGEGVQLQLRVEG